MNPKMYMAQAPVSWSEASFSALNLKAALVRHNWLAFSGPCAAEVPAAREPY